MNNKNNLVVEKSEHEYKIGENDTVFRTDLGKYSKITFVANPNKNNNIKKINKYQYIDLRTGKIKQYNLDKPTSKSDVNRKLKKYEEIVLYNFAGGASELFVTLGYKATITDIAVIKGDYDRFLYNLKQDYKDIDCIALFEQNGNWSWHTHIFIKNNKHKKLFIERAKLIEYWGNENVYVMPNKNTFQTLGHSKDKRDDRLERFMYFPKGEKIYHRTKGIKTPIKEKMTFKNCPEFNSNNHTKVSNKTYHITNPSNDKVVNTIATDMYRQNLNKQASIKESIERTTNDNETSITPPAPASASVSAPSAVAPPPKELTEKERKIREMIERQNQPNNRIFWEFI